VDARGAFEFFATSVSRELPHWPLAKKSSDATSAAPEPVPTRRRSRHPHGGVLGGARCCSTGRSLRHPCLRSLEVSRFRLPGFARRPTPVDQHRAPPRYSRMKWPRLATQGRVVSASSDATSTVPEPEHPAPAQLLRRGLTNLSQHTRCVAAPDREEDVLHVFTRFAKRLDFICGERWLEC
jgi:hypothetical protein